MTSNIKLPKTPTVKTKKQSIIIHFSNNSEIVWGDETTTEEAKKVDKELEIELRAVKYVQWHVQNFIQDMKNMLNSHDIDERLLDSILIDGHTFARAKINNQTVNSIIMGAERGLRKQVLDNLSSDDYIV